MTGKRVDLYAGDRVEGLSQLRTCLVSGPPLFCRAGRESAVSHVAQKDLSRIKEVWYCAEEDKPVERSEIVKGYEVEKGDYITLAHEDLKKIAPVTATTMEVLQFVGTDEIDPLLFESSYYVAPEEKVSKPYALFMAALKATKRDAVAKIATHNREHIVLIRVSEGGLVLHTLYYEDELHRTHKPEAPKTAFSAKELEMAKSLVGHLTAPFKIKEFHDAYRENVEQLIEERRKGKKITTVKQPRKAPVIDLMEALKRSLKSAPEKAARKRKAA